MWKSRFTRWCGLGCKPKSCASNMWESQVTGCQLAECPVCNAQATPGQVKPDRT